MKLVTQEKLKSGRWFFICIFTLCFLLSPRANSQLAETKIGNLSSYRGEVFIKNWQILGPFYAHYTLPYNYRPIDHDHFKVWNTSEKDIDADQFYALGEHNPDRFMKDTFTLKNISYTQNNIPLAIHEILNSTVMGNSYSACVIDSKTDQEAAFLFGSDDGAKVWVNHQLCFSLDGGGRRLERNSNIFSARLHKGKNFVLVKLNRSWTDDASYFYLNMSSMSYAKEIYLSKTTADFLKTPLVKTNDSLVIRLNPAFHKNQSITVQALNSHNKILLNENTGATYGCKIPLGALHEGVYTCRVVAGTDTFSQKFVYGNYRKLFNELKPRMKTFATDERNTINIETMLKRFVHLDSFSIRNNRYDDNLLNRKIALTLFQLETMCNGLTARQEIFANQPGWQLKGFRSAIDHHIENYMVYMPDNYKKESPVPLAVILPWVSQYRLPYAESWHVADLDRIEMLCRLANKHGFGILWTSSRTYEQYNLNPITSAATFETLEAVKKEYNIDTTRLYGYGACYGGALTLVTANRFPSLFAAVGVEGPELSYADSTVKLYPSSWVNDNNIFTQADNYYNLPIYITHAENDKKASFSLSQKLVTLLKGRGVHITLDTLKNITKDNLFDLSHPMKRSWTGSSPFSKTKKKNLRLRLCSAPPS